MRLDGVFERAAVDLHRIRDVATAQRTREDRRAHHQVVGKGHLRRGSRDDLSDRADIRCQVAVELGIAQLLEGPGLNPLIAISHVHRQESADVRAIDRAGRITNVRNPELAGVPVSN